MRNLLMAFTLLCSGVMVSDLALATPVQLTEHNYGRPGYSPAGSDVCGTVTRDDMLIRSSCIGYTDLFSLASLDAANIDYLQLTLNFAGTNNRNCLRGDCQMESWQLDLLNASGSTLGSFALLQSGAAIQQNFIINRLNIAAFTDLFSQGNLWFGFSENSTASHNFRLVSSQLAVFAVPAQEPVPVPVPATLAIFGLGLVGLCLRRKFKC